MATEIPPLFEALGHDPARERQALDRLARGDRGGGREALNDLAGSLLEAAGPAREAAVRSLLLDLLQRVNRRVHRGPALRGAYHQMRAELIDQFSRCSSADETRRCFETGLTTLLERDRSTARKPNPLIARAKEVIDRDYASRTSLSSVARELHVSASYLSRLFRRETGVTLTTYVQQVRIGHARRYLQANPDVRLSEVAYQVGYRNYRDFYRNFVKYESASPRDVRRRLTRAG